MWAPHQSGPDGFLCPQEAALFCNWLSLVIALYKSTPACNPVKMTRSMREWWCGGWEFLVSMSDNSLVSERRSQNQSCQSFILRQYPVSSIPQYRLQYSPDSSHHHAITAYIFISSCHHWSLSCHHWSPVVLFYPRINHCFNPEWIRKVTEYFAGVFNHFIF